MLATLTNDATLGRPFLLACSPVHRIRLEDSQHEDRSSLQSVVSLADEVEQAGAQKNAKVCW